MKEYITYKDHVFENEPLNIKEFCAKNGLEGSEVFFDDIVPRDLKLFNNEAEKIKVIDTLTALNVKRLHCSYWAYPTSFLTKNNFSELTERFGGVEKVIEYYGDLTGEHLWNRWQQEYEIAAALGAQAYTFHLIDYAPIDGEWAFTMPIADIRQAMIYMIQQFLLNLDAADLLSDNSPHIELENAGWGLEYGTQSKSDYIDVFSQLYDPHNKVKIGWDINHLLHALGKEQNTGNACFMLPDDEKTAEMAEMEKQYGKQPVTFACKWVESNILTTELVNKAGSIHLSDCKLKNFAYFVRGKLQPPYSDEMDALPTWEEKEEFGVAIVLTHYDSHVPLQTGTLNGADTKTIIDVLQKNNPDLVILHELKNSVAIQEDLDIQRNAMNGAGKQYEISCYWTVNYK
jgi:hypothetical protein